jgi:hypothetical protein
MTLTQTAAIPLKPRVMLRFIVLAIVVGTAGVGLYSLYRSQYPDGIHEQHASSLPAGALALSAYLEESVETRRPLIVVGWVGGETTSTQEGKVKLTLRRLKKDFRQSLLLNVKHGKFEAPYVLGFTAIDPDEPIHILAEAWIPNPSGERKRVTEEIYLNARPPLFSKTMFYPSVMSGFIILLGIFLWAFTGQSSPRKNRMAIVFSYVIISVFLALPLLAPVILPLAFPEALEAMKRTPVGLVITKAEPEAGSLPQWALNIGGHVPKKGDLSDPDVVEVQGGLVIPLYVIILSVIGGTINMTRQVPKFQEEAEVGENGIAGKVGSVVRRFLPGQPQASDQSGSPDVADMRLKDDPGTRSTGVPHSSHVAPAGQELTHAGSIAWRTGLLNQYMFLISAPFLAIATYYMLIGLSLTKVPVMVLVAFSVGLISEPILRTIIDTAARFLRQQPPADVVAAGQQQAVPSQTPGLAAAK